MSTQTNPGGASPGGVAAVAVLGATAHAAAVARSRVALVSMYQTALTKPSTDMAIKPYSSDVGICDMGGSSVAGRADASKPTSADSASICDGEFNRITVVRLRAFDVVVALALAVAGVGLFAAVSFFRNVVLAWPA